VNEKTGERIAPEVKAGDKILFGKYSGTEIEVDGQDLLFLREGDILAVL
jgi:chaperonin GroES